MSDTPGIHPSAAVELGAHARVLFTDRTNGNLSSAGGEGAEHGGQARERLRELAALRALARGYQVHGTFVEQLRESPSPHELEVTPQREADGQATQLREVGMLVLTADCLPVGLACADAVAMVHAGWRGLAGGVLEAGVQALRELGGSGEITAIVGPGAGPCCYEVGAEVRAAFAGAHVRGDKIDLRAIAHDRLLRAGVARVDDLAACTICDERYFSHRREGARSGRQGGVAWLS
jgi:YfiH family protein